MKTNLRENIEDNANYQTEKKSSGIVKTLFDFVVKRIRNMSKIEIVAYSASSLMILIIFGSGVSTMVQESTNVFPIHQDLKLLVGYLLMLILVFATHVAIDLCTEILFNWKQYNTHYKVSLPITATALVLVCYFVQAEGGDIVDKSEVEARIAKIKADTLSANLKQLDTMIGQLQDQLKKANKDSESYYDTKMKRKGKWLSKEEHGILAKVKQSEIQLTNQLTALMASRIEEERGIQNRIDQEVARAYESLEREMAKNKGRAGMAEFVLIVICMVVKSYKKRFKEAAIETQELIEEFEKNLSIDDREALLPRIEPLRYDAENHHLLIELDGKTKYFSIAPMIKQATSCRSRLNKAKSEDSKMTQLRNIAYLERIISMTPMELDDLKRVFGFRPMNEDYWNSPTGNVSDNVSETLEKRKINDSQRLETGEVDLFP